MQVQSPSPSHSTDDAAATQAALQRIAALEARVERRATGPAGQRVVWRRLGGGPPLVLLHGGHGSWLHWVANIEALAERHAVWVPDMPGYGESDDVAPGIAALVDALGVALDDAVGAGTPIGLAGFSFGGLIAATLAARRPGPGKLALLGPAGSRTTRRPTGPLQAWRQIDDERERREVLRRNLALHMLYAAPDALALEVHVRSCIATRFNSRSVARTADIVETLRGVDVPVLIGWGEHDVTATPSLAGPALLDGRAHRRFELLPGVGHWVQYEAAEAVNARLAEWFAGPG